MRPVLFSIGGIDFFSAPIFAGLSALAAFYYFLRRRPSSLNDDDFWTLMMALALGVIGGGVLFYVLAFGNGPAANLRMILLKRRIPGGSFFGSFWGAALLAYLYCRARKLDWRPVADLLGITGPLALIIMRMGCLLHGCCHGRPTDLPWAIVFTDPRCRVRSSWRGLPLHPSQLYEALGALALFLFLHFVAAKRVEEGKAPPGSVFLLSLGLYAALRFFLEFARGSDPGVFSLAGLGTAQIFSLATLAAVFPLSRWNARA